MFSRPDGGVVDAAWVRRETCLRVPHLLDVDELTKDDMLLVFETARAMKAVNTRLDTLSGKRVVNLFYENSTRTRSSFELAAKRLGADVVNIMAGASSVAKGESLVDTVKTILALGADFLVMRHADSGAPYLAAKYFAGSVINAGDGRHAHPTQALLDAYTMREELGDLAGRKVVIVGDILHSRVARSNIWALGKLGASVVICGPPTLLPSQPGLAAWRNLCLTGSISFDNDFDRAIEGADVVMALRLQLERMASGLLPSIGEYRVKYGLTCERLGRAKPGAIVMHPGPMNEGVEIDPEVASGPSSRVEQQVANGVAVRMAILTLLRRRTA